MFSPQAQSMTEGIRQSLMEQGSGHASATRQAYAAAFAMVRRQAAIVMFLNVFRLMSILFLAMLPFLLLMKRPRGRKAPARH